jgi:hypothetical protein
MRATHLVFHTANLRGASRSDGRVRGKWQGRRGARAKKRRGPLWL